MIKTRFHIGMRKMPNIIFYDGVCHFCNQTIQFIIKQDRDGYYSFASLQSEIGMKLMNEFNIPNNMETIILLDNNYIYSYSDAPLQISRRLRGGWRFIYLLVIVPKSIRDYFYIYFSKNRYKWFGKSENCMLPTPELRKRFLE